MLSWPQRNPLRINFDFEYKGVLLSSRIQMFLMMQIALSISPLYQHFTVFNSIQLSYFFNTCPAVSGAAVRKTFGPSFFVIVGT